jgi:mannose-6-phosphate isomerase-like protein (cupin superfamily)
MSTNMWKAWRKNLMATTSASARPRKMGARISATCKAIFEERFCRRHVLAPMVSGRAYCSQTTPVGRLPSTEVSHDLDVGLTALVASAITLACASIAQEPAKLLDSTAWKWEDMAAKKTDVGELRPVVRAPTRTLDELEMHITTLNAPTASHPPHTHPTEEMVIIREGALQAHVNGREVVVGPGSVLFSLRCSARGAEHRRCSGHLLRHQLGQPGQQDEEDPEASLGPRHSVVRVARPVTAGAAPGGVPASVAAPRAWRSASARAGAGAVPG